MLLGNNKQVYRRLRINITEGSYFFILIDDFTGHLAGDNLAENTIHFHCSISSPWLLFIISPLFDFSLVSVRLVSGFALFKQVSPVNIVGDNSGKVLYIKSQYSFSPQVLIGDNLYLFNGFG